MSTLPAAAPATQPALLDAAPQWHHFVIGLAVLGTVALVATLTAWLLGAFRQGVAGPTRLPRGEALWPLAVGIGAAVLGLAVVGVAGAAFLGATDPEALGELASPPSAIAGESPDGAQRMIRVMQISALMYLAATLAALGVILAARLGGWRGRLGLGLHQVPWGLAAGFFGLLVIVPWVMTAGVVLQMIRKSLAIEGETMHELIRAMRDNPQAELIVWGLLSAVVIAPVVEEILFRGLFQTTAVHVLARLFGQRAGDRDLIATASPPAPPLPSPPLPASPSSAPTPPPPTDFAGHLVRHDLAYRSAHVVVPPQSHWPARGARWGGIILTSILFALMHEMWMFPLIFLLSLGLGYIYERTGNLWAAIVVHFGFNSLNLLMILPLILSGA